MTFILIVTDPSQPIVPGDATMNPAVPNGENGWYRSVSLVPPSGYKIALAADGSFGDEIAIEEGATMVRIGTALVGNE